MKCHYEVLSLPHDADDAEIKKSYRKLALQYHPDKNPDNTEEVTELFREVQSAYDVLSDPQERAWYDKHREEILKGGGDYVDDALDVMHYFNPSIYNGFDDGNKSFYTVFRDAFCNLGKEDESYMEGDDQLIPEFGYSYSDYETVVKPFYSYWLCYRTKKTFVWKQVYDVRTAANRPTQRLMEKENKKLRDACRKKRNEEIRALVTYVRKRDKRVQAEIKQIKLKQEEQQRKAKEIQEAQKMHRSKILDNYEEQEWMAFDDSKLDELDSHYDSMFGSVPQYDSDESDVENVLYCIACDKNFKSDKALANHEKSKKHKENVELIKNELEGDIFDALCISGHGFDEVPDGKLVDHICEDYDEDFDDDCGLPRLSSFNLPANVVKRNVIDKSTKSGEDYSMPSSKKSKKKKKKGAVLFDISEDSDADVEDFDSSDDNKYTKDDSEDNIKIEKDNNKIETEQVADSNVENISKGENESSDVGTSSESLENKIEECADETNNKKDKPTGTSSESLENKIKECTDETNNKKDKSTNKVKKNKKNNNDDDDTGSFNCEICTKVFPTRNKLFKHIKAEGHAMLKEETKKTKKEKGKKK